MMEQGPRRDLWRPSRAVSADLGKRAGWVSERGGAGVPCDCHSPVPFKPITLFILSSFQGGSVVKGICLPMQKMQETPVQSLGQKDSLEEDMATHSSILAWRIPWTEEPGGPQSMGSQRVR